jgi:hypothetical protein
MADITSPLEKLKMAAKKDFHWAHEHHVAFETVQRAIRTFPTLYHPKFSRPFYLATDASTLGVGGFLYQYKEEPSARRPSPFMRPIGFASRSLTTHDTGYSIPKKVLNPTAVRDSRSGAGSSTTDR